MMGTIAALMIGLLWGYEAIIQIQQLQAAKAKEARDEEESSNGKVGTGPNVVPGVSPAQR